MTTSSGDATLGLNLTWLVPGVVGGSEEYTMRLLEAVATELAPSVSLRIYGTPSLAEAYRSLFAALDERHRLVVGPEPGSRPARVAMENTWLAKVSSNDDVVHHAGGTVPFRRPAPAIVTIHDLQPLEMPQHFGPIKRAWLGRALPHAAANADLVLCPSEFTAKQLTALLDVDPGRVRVVPHGYHPVGGDDNDPAGSVIDANRFGRFVLFPAIAYAHKRHIDVVEALARLGSAHDRLQVVFTGRPGPEQPAVAAAADRLGVADRVHWLGRVPRADLAALYRSAAALVFPSSYEGFGNPALEAMAAGTPVVASDAGALPEVIADAGLIYPVGDVEQLAKALDRLLGDGDLAAALASAGLARASDFDPGIAALRLAHVYAESIDRSGR